MLCLAERPLPGDRRLEATTRARPATATPCPFTFGPSGFLYFFEPTNIEMLVKTLDGCAINNHYLGLRGGHHRRRIHLAGDRHPQRPAARIPQRARRGVADRQRPPGLRLRLKSGPLPLPPLRGRRGENKRGGSPSTPKTISGLGFEESGRRGAGGVYPSVMGSPPLPVRGEGGRGGEVLFLRRRGGHAANGGGPAPPARAGSSPFRRVPGRREMDQPVAAGAPGLGAGDLCPSG